MVGQEEIRDNLFNTKVKGYDKQISYHLLNIVSLIKLSDYTSDLNERIKGYKLVHSILTDFADPSHRNKAIKKCQRIFEHVEKINKKIDYHQRAIDSIQLLNKIYNENGKEIQSCIQELSETIAHIIDCTEVKPGAIQMS